MVAPRGTLKIARGNRFVDVPVLTRMAASKSGAEPVPSKTGAPSVRRFPVLGVCRRRVPSATNANTGWLVDRRHLGGNLCGGQLKNA